MSQLVGVLLLALAGWLLWSPWVLVIAGVLLLLAPEVGELMKRRGAK